MAKLFCIVLYEVLLRHYQTLKNEFELKEEIISECKYKINITGKQHWEKQKKVKKTVKVEICADSLHFVLHYDGTFMTVNCMFC